MEFVLFMFGASAGSFLKLIADRYEPDLFLWNKKIIGGRSRCSFCGAELRWFELIPLFSFLFQKGKCRRCRKRIGFQYPLIELISGFIFVFVPLQLARSFVLHYSFFIILSAVWISIFSVLLLISLIDFRLQIIPDEANIILLILGIFLIFFQPFGDFQGSFIGHYALLFGWRQNVFSNHFLALLGAACFFAFLIAITRGRAMGVGDLKLAGALGFVFAWPDIILIILVSFIIGSLVGGGAILLNKKSMKSYVAFGPFLAIASFGVFFFGYQMVDFYFRLFTL